MSSTFSAARRKPSSPFLQVSIRLFKSETASGDLPDKEELPEDMLLLDELPIDDEPLFDEELLLIEPKLLPGVELVLPGVEPGRLLFGEDILLEPLAELDEVPNEKLLLEELPKEEPLCEPLVERAEESVLPGIELEEPELLPDDKLLPGVEETPQEPELSDDSDEESEGSGFEFEDLFVESPLVLFVLRLELIFPAWLVLTCPS